MTDEPGLYDLKPADVLFPHSLRPFMLANAIPVRTSTAVPPDTVWFTTTPAGPPDSWVKRRFIDTNESYTASWSVQLDPTADVSFLWERDRYDDIDQTTDHLTGEWATAPPAQPIPWRPRIRVGDQ